VQDCVEVFDDAVIKLSKHALQHDTKHFLVTRRAAKI